MSHFKVEEGPSQPAKVEEEDRESSSSDKTVVPASPTVTPAKKGLTSMSVAHGQSTGLHAMVLRRLEEGLACPPSPSTSPPTSPFIWKRRGAPRVRLGSMGEKN
jgi:hypothetical protein